MPRIPAMGVHQLPVSVHQRPRLISRALAEQEISQATTRPEPSDVLTLSLRDRAERFFSLFKKDDQIWLFESSGYGVKKIKGLALERQGCVIQILVIT